MIKALPPIEILVEDEREQFFQRIAVVDDLKVIITLKVTLIKPYRLADSNAPTMESIV